MIATASHGPSALWYATRGAGAMTLVLLTASVVLGIGEVRHWQPVGAPRFALAALHRTISLFALVLLVVHVVTTLIDPFPRISLLNAGVPFVTDYRPLWMGLGTLASDLLVALVLTSLVRRRLGYRAWRGLHWLAYGCWPVAVLHGLGSGSDTKSTWMLTLTLACVGAVVVALGSRLAAPETRPAVQIGTAAITVLSGIGLAVWLPQGPLARGWARRAGTPAAVLAAFAPKAAVAPVRAASVDALAKPFTATIAGTIHSGSSADGIAVVDLSTRLSGGPPGVLRIRIGGQALPEGGVQMDRSAVTLGPPADPSRYRGRIESLNNNQLRALVGSPEGRAVRLTVDLSLGQSTVGGQVQGTPLRSAGA
jgi:methionine sulfoxide reductase heme-binding subunit